MITSIDVDFDIGNYNSAYVEYLSEGGVFSGSFRKAYAYEKGNNLYAYFEFVCKKSGKIANFNLFLYKDKSPSYKNKDGKDEFYLGFRQLNAIAYFLELKKIVFDEKVVETLYGQSIEAYPLDFLDKPLILGFSTEEFLDKNGNAKSKIYLDRVFNIKMQSLKEAKENAQPSEINTFKPKHKSLEKENANPYETKENQSYNPYGESKYIETKENEEMPF